MFKDRNVSRNRYLLTKWVLNDQGFSSDEIKILSEKCLTHRDMLMSESSEINRIRNECFSLTHKLIKIQNEISEAIKNQIFFMNPYLLNK